MDPYSDDAAVLVKLEALEIPGSFLIKGHRTRDARGGFRKVIGLPDVAPEAPIPLTVVEAAVSTNKRSGTVRGLHYQAPPDEQAKTIWLEHGAVFDVIVDIRPGSATFGRSVSLELSASEDVAVHMPRGVAHGFQTLVDDTTMVYLMDAPYAPRSARTLRWDDPHLGIAWPLAPTQISASDQEGASWPPRS